MIEPIDAADWMQMNLLVCDWPPQSCSGGISTFDLFPFT